ncbi:hypothetical protein BGZ89_006361 [Linnemannia elongata]|nr:hypothetical protein BGZ89_006361 [Linnemannia elongata]
MVWKFQPTSGAPQAISSTFDLMKEIYIDDEIVPIDLEHGWSQHVAVFSVGKPGFEAYLERTFERREHWA